MLDASATAKKLLDAFCLFNDDLPKSMREHNLESEVLAIMESLAEVVGDQEVVFGVGGIFRNREHGSGEPFPEHPNMYDFTVVTPKIIALDFGDIHKGGHQSEQTTVVARKNVSAVRVVQRPGDTDEYGNVPRSHEVEIKFSKGQDIKLPLLDEDLTPEGVERLSRLVRSLYEDLAA